MERDLWYFCKALVNIGPIPIIAGVMYWARLVASDEDTMTSRKLIANVLFASLVGWAAFNLSSLLFPNPQVSGAIGVLIGCSGKDGYVLLMRALNRKILGDDKGI